MRKVFSIDISDVDYALENFSLAMTILSLFLSIKPLFGDVEIARDIAAGIINAYMFGVDIDSMPGYFIQAANEKIQVFSRI